MLKDLLDKYEYDMLKCLYCGQCRYVCPTLRYEGWESASPRGKVKLIYGWAKGELEPTDGMIEKIYHCCGCEHCVVECPSGIDIVDLVRDARVELVRLRGRAIEPLRTIDDRIRDNHNFLGRENEERLFWAEFEELNLTQNDAHSENLYFVGCLPSYWCIEDASSTAKILKSVNYDFKVLGGEEWCCGLIPFWSGETDIALRMAEHNIKVMEERAVKNIFTTCPGCYRMLSRDYRETLGLKSNFSVQHTTELLNELLKDGKLKFREKLKLRVTYHDPCHIGRNIGFFEEPRELLSAIPGLELVEMEKNRKNANCCGGMLAPVSEDLALKVGMDRVKEALDVEAEALVTACPQCYINLRNSALELDAKIEVYTLSMFLAKAMKL